MYTLVILLRIIQPDPEHNWTSKLPPTYAMLSECENAKAILIEQIRNQHNALIVPLQIECLQVVNDVSNK